MPRRVILRPEVPQDLHNIVEWMESRSAAAADRFIEAVFAAFDDLAEMPGKGSLKRLRDRRLTDVRSWWVPGFRKYLILYRYTDDALFILAVQHGARNIRKLLRGRLWQG